MRPLFKFLLMVLFILLMLPPGALAALGAERRRQRFVQWVFRGLCQIVGLQIERQGVLTARRPLLIVSNHTSYLDILALGAAAPLSFTPKSDIRSWPLVNLCCLLSGCVFVERKPAKLPQTRIAIARALRRGRVICLFPEGTTGDGTALKPFKSGFFSLGEEAPDLVIQPVSLRYTQRDGRALDAAGRAAIAWTGDTRLLPHLMRTLSARSIVARITFHEPLTPASYPSRKELARMCGMVIEEGFRF